MNPSSVLGTDQDLYSVLGQVNIGVIITDPARKIVYVNATFTRETGYALAEIQGWSCSFLQGPGTAAADCLAFREALDRAVPIQRTVLNYHRSGRELYYRVNITPIFTGEELTGFIGIQEDATELYRAQQALEHAAYSDVLTGLWNRRKFDACLDEAQHSDQPFALFNIDLNGFKQVNDEHGHLAGDQLLQRVAGNIRSLCRQPREEGFRLGGDEFAILCFEDASTLSTRAEQLREDLRARADQAALFSIGVAFYPAEDTNVWRVFRIADQRMYAQKVVSP